MREATVILSSLVLLAGCRAESPRAPDPAPPPAGLEVVEVGGRVFALEGPYAGGNLACYLLVGEGTDDRQFVTLDQGLEAGTVRVAEKGAGGGAEVNELVLENRGDRWLFLQAGDVVKGGKQDRAIGQDLLVPPHAAPQPLAAFCVEHGRWAGTTGQFASNTALLNGPGLKAAVQRDADQNLVWAEVARNEDTIARVAKLPALRSISGTYNAVVENKEIAARRDACTRAVLEKVRAQPRAVGMAVAINGQLVGVETYSSPALFRAMARKLLESYALDAVAAGAREADAPAPAAVRAFLEEAARGGAKEEDLRGSMRRRVLDGKEILGFEYRLEEAEGEGRGVVHGSYLRK